MTLECFISDINMLFYKTYCIEKEFLYFYFRKKKIFVRFRNIFLKGKNQNSMIKIAKEQIQRTVTVL
jgi:hypothetical protein